MGRLPDPSLPGANLYPMPSAPSTGRPAYPYRYKHFLMACALVATSQIRKESAAAFGGTSETGGEVRARKGQKPKPRPKRKRRGKG